MKPSLALRALPWLSCSAASTMKLSLRLRALPETLGGRPSSWRRKPAASETSTSATSLTPIPLPEPSRPPPAASLGRLLAGTAVAAAPLPSLSAGLAARLTLRDAERLTPLPLLPKRSLRRRRGGGCKCSTESHLLHKSCELSTLRSRLSTTSHVPREPEPELWLRLDPEAGDAWLFVRERLRTSPLAWLALAALPRVSTLWPPAPSPPLGPALLSSGLPAWPPSRAPLGLPALPALEGAFDREALGLRRREGDPALLPLRTLWFSGLPGLLTLRLPPLMLRLSPDAWRLKPLCVRRSPLPGSESRCPGGGSLAALATLSLKLPRRGCCSSAGLRMLPLRTLPALRRLSPAARPPALPMLTALASL